MKFRSGFVSNSSTASFIIQTRPSEWDHLFNKMDDKAVAAATIPKEKVDLLKKHGFWPTKEMDPFAREFGRIRGKTEDDTFLTFRVTCNEHYVMEFLVAHEIPFKAAGHYAQYLYTYDPKEECIYRLQNFGIEYMTQYKKLEKAMSGDDEYSYLDIQPLKRYSRDEFLKDYDEEESLKIIGEPGIQESENE